MPIDIDRDAAHDAAQRELTKPIYPRGSLTDQLVKWIDDVFYRILANGATVPGGWLTIAVLLILIAVAVVVAVRVARRTMRTDRGRHDGLFGAHDMGSAEHRAASERFAAEGQWVPAIQHRVRAIARLLEETAVLNPLPGRTATELARAAGRSVPGLAAEFTRAAESFNDVTYGGHAGTESGYHCTADLDGRLLTHATTGTPAPDPSPVRDSWAQVR